MKPLSPPGPDRARGVSAWWYAGALSVFLLGLGAAVVLFIGGRRDAEMRSAEATRAAIGQTGVVQIDEPGEYLVFYQGPVPDDRPSGQELLDRLSLTLTGADSGERLSLTPYEGLEQTVSRSGASYVPLAQVEVVNTGRYRLKTRPLDGVRADRGSVGVGKEILAPLFASVVAAVVAVGVGLVLAVLMLIWVLVVRGRARKERQAGVPPNGVRGPPGPAGWPGAAQPAPPRTLAPPPPPGFETTETAER